MSTEAQKATNTIVVNDKAIPLELPVSLTEALQMAEQAEGRYVVVLNDTIVPRSEHQSAMVSPGDKLEIIAPMSGG